LREHFLEVSSIVVHCWKIANREYFFLVWVLFVQLPTLLFALVFTAFRFEVSHTLKVARRHADGDLDEFGDSRCLEIVQPALPLGWRLGIKSSDGIK